ncbi:hypothetical protein O6H91_16G061600 [Diphasiastrum complanatum]|uniref:Uncharacterized protein n=2 Tax=Diphasiastrum complanatum TaxID=34168 RepID=A0ACC2BCR4_DIPCM|nr:hypothetical protein O6H91_16G061600 [Diphasiastrum complanatum]KAJ7527579.1 hypothetical protein O6H91_16G061600 [Diphasiastrum complanatum]
MPLSEATSASGEASGSSENHGSQQHQHSSATSTRSGINVGTQIPAKKKRNLPGTPDPDAEVIALSPNTLMATNRFVCEICGKGFQRDQNLQLHRRGHNLPWKLRQRTGNEPRKRVYICPELSCVHHDPSRALGDLTGIKKHFCRKHGEKKWKCDKCNKRYAVQSDWKAHSKTCGTREYRCDCGTLFSRRDSFITHRAFCDALAEESARVSIAKQGPQVLYVPEGNADVCSSKGLLSLHGATSSPQVSYAVRNVASGLHPEVLGTNLAKGFPLMPSAWAQGSADQGLGAPSAGPRLSLWSGPISGSSLPAGRHLTDDPVLLSQLSARSPFLQPLARSQNKVGMVGVCGNVLTSGSSFGGLQGSGFDFQGSITHSASAGLSLSAAGFTGQSAGSCSSVSNILSKQTYTSTNSQMSATALLQKAAQMGATASTSSLLKGFGMAGTDATSFRLGAFWQGPQQEQGKSPSLGNTQTSLSHHDLLENRAGNVNIESGVSTSSGPSSLAAQSKSAEQVGNRDSTASMPGYAGMFGGGLSTFPPMFGSYTGNGGGVRSSRNSHASIHMSPEDNLHTANRNFQVNLEANGTPLLPGLVATVSKVEEGADRLTRDFLGVNGTVGRMGKTLSQRDLASISSIGLRPDANSLANHSEE